MPGPAAGPIIRAADGSRSAPKEGGSTSVRTPWVEMELDHDTGAMRGTVLKGANAGRTLDRLGRDALLAFYREAGSSDTETARLLEATWIVRLTAIGVPTPRTSARRRTTAPRCRARRR